jgi:hypothetical protein
MFLMRHFSLLPNTYVYGGATTYGPTPMIKEDTGGEEGGRAAGPTQHLGSYRPTRHLTIPGCFQARDFRKTPYATFPPT